MRDQQLSGIVTRMADKIRRRGSEKRRAASRARREVPIAPIEGALSAGVADLLLDVSAPIRQRNAIAHAISSAPDPALDLAQRMVAARPASTIAPQESAMDDQLVNKNLRVAVLKVLRNPAILHGLAVRPYVRRDLAHLATSVARSLPRRSPAAPPARPNRPTDTAAEALAAGRLYVTPLRYPGGKGKLAAFIKNLLETNDLLDGEYCEPYAGGAAIAVELLLQEYVRRIHINDVSRPLYSFWYAVLNETEPLLRLISDTPLTMKSWDRQRDVFNHPDDHSAVELGFATFFLNRTNRSGILNAGVIGGRAQTGKWTIEARYNVPELARRIEAIAEYRNRIQLTCLNALDFLRDRLKSFSSRTLVYLDPPYYEKGKDLYYNYYEHADHAAIAAFVQRNMRRLPWVVSYDNVEQIRDLYAKSRGIAYGLGYSARDIRTGSEVMFFSDSLFVPNLTGAMRPMERGPQPKRSLGFQPRARERAIARGFAVGS